MIFNDVEPEHLGGGVIIFRNAIEYDFSSALNMFEQMLDEEHSQMYEIAQDPQTGEEVYLNKSGYLFTKDSVDSMPRRASSVHQDTRHEVIELLTFMEESKDKYLLKYFEKFPLSYNCIWWKVKGHIVSYKDDVYLGPHSDISAEYVYGIHQTSNELALRNVISSIVYINSSVDDDSMLNGINFTGGHHYFNYLEIDYAPKAGDIMMFPSNYMAAHEVKPVIKGHRVSYLGWYCQGTPNPLVHEDVCDPLKNPDLGLISTNVYLPTLREDYRSYLISRGYDISSEEYRVTNLNS
jgi:hypothetical protein